MALFLVRFGEMGLKSKAVRTRFQRVLQDNIVRAHLRRNLPCIVRGEYGRVYVESDDPSGTAHVLAHTFGVVSFSEVETSEATPEALTERAVAQMRAHLRPGLTFAVRARRIGSHPFSSLDLEREVGRSLLETYGTAPVRVNLSAPDLTVHLEVRDRRGYVFTDVSKGPGGMPLGTQGLVLAALDDRRSAAAAWLIMKRGCKALGLVGADGLEALELLRRWDPEMETVAAPDPPGLSRLVESRKPDALVIGWSLEKFSTRSSPELGIPIFYPLIGMSPEEVEALLARIAR